MTGELRLVRDLLARFGRGNGDEVWLGDDTAVVKPPSARLLLTIDPVVAGVHFDESAAAADVGWNAMVRNLSDVAAMGGRPLHALVSLVVPSPCPWPVEHVVAGLAEAADGFGCRVVGGDTSGGPALVVTVAVTGTVDGRPVLRSGARPDDLLFVTGPLGAARGRFRPRLAEGEAARVGGASAMIDLSDGLPLDLRRLAEASSVGAELDEILPVAPGGGWDEGDCYELLLAAADPDELARAFSAAGLTPPTPIGRCVREVGRLRLGGRELPRGGWVHRL
ncbi:MAG TPA: thiamine-phosphate kinase [Acidimicrobiales bacterium]|jgi:thiamine-monophosphate kinase